MTSSLGKDVASKTAVLKDYDENPSMFRPALFAPAGAAKNKADAPAGELDVLATETVRDFISNIAGVTRYAGHCHVCHIPSGALHC